MKTIERNLYRMTVCLVFSVIFLVNALSITHLYYFLAALTFIGLAAIFGIRANRCFTGEINAGMAGADNLEASKDAPPAC